MFKGSPLVFAHRAWHDFREIMTEKTVARSGPGVTGGLVAEIATAMPLRAAGFIVTLYGDAVVPVGGEVWVGTLIDTCARVGISETLVRTAVSRLVAAGQLEGVRRGRRSFYHLTRDARSEFDAAARLIYGPPQVTGWRFVYLPDETADAHMAQLERQGYARLRPHLAVGPAGAVLPLNALVFDTDAVGATHMLPAFAAELWDLAPVAQGYETFISRFSPVVAAVPALTGSEALALRLLLVHAWRHALFQDPRLPALAVPPDWAGLRARRVFARLYCALTPAAESHIADQFVGVNGGLRNEGRMTEARLAHLSDALNVETVQ